MKLSQAEKRKAIGYVSPAMAKKKNQKHEKEILAELETMDEVCTQHLVNIGMDISVARRIQVDMHRRGILTLRIAVLGGKKTHYYSKSPPNIMRDKWVPTDNGAVVGIHRGER